MERLHTLNGIDTMDFLVKNFICLLSSFWSSNSSCCSFVICLTLVLAWFLISVLSFQYFSISCNASWNSIDELSLSCIACDMISAMLSNLLWASNCIVVSCFSCFTVNILKDIYVIVVAREKSWLVPLNTIPTDGSKPFA